jgi:glycosyltransferase involved in cell wall biosynthesis
MIVLHVIGTVNPESGGPIEGIFTSSAVLREQGCDREIMSLDSPSDPWVKTCPLRLYPMGIRHPHYPVWREKIPWLRYGYTPHYVPWLKANAKRYDAVIINGLWNYAALGAWRALSKTDTRYFVYAHGMLDPYFNKINPIKGMFKQFLWWFSEGRLLAHATGVMFVTEEERRRASHAFWPFRCRDRVVPYGIVDIKGNPDAQAASFRATLPKLADRDFILFLSRIHPKKGCDLLIESFAKIAAKNPNLDLVVAGPDSLDWGTKLRNIATKLGVADRIHWPGMLKGDLKWGAFHASEAFILPSHQENFGIVIAEAMACSKPVLTTFKVNTWREVQSSRAGFIENDNLDGITGLFEKFVNLSADEKQEMGRRSRKGFIEEFDIRAMAPRLIEAVRAS